VYISDVMLLVVSNGGMRWTGETAEITVKRFYFKTQRELQL
jgi:hypothetical protein